MNKRSKYHVLPATDGWKVKKEHSERASGIFQTKEEAIEKGKELAKAASLGQILIHNKNGQIGTEYTYAENPRNIPG